ncbi:hypothetical protein K1719_002219 [Acacia pycnantha]|nr:hypothetical protein K1719_002219 [Acacia pycnantha]
MIVAYERAGLVAHAKRLLLELRQTDNIPRETTIKILARAGRIEEATWVFRQAFDAGEIKDRFVFICMINLFSRNKYRNVIEVFEKMREQGYFPDSNVIALVLNAFGKLREFENADLLYVQMQECCVFPDEVHFQMLSLYGARGDFMKMESLFEKLDSNPNINKELLKGWFGREIEASKRKRSKTMTARVLKEVDLWMVWLKGSNRSGSMKSESKMVKSKIKYGYKRLGEALKNLRPKPFPECRGTNHLQQSPLPWSCEVPAKSG